MQVLERWSCRRLSRAMHGALTSLVSPDFQFLRPISRSPAVICSEIACAPPSYLVQALGVINEHRTSTRKWTCGRRECDHVLFQIESDGHYYLFRKSYPKRFRLWRIRVLFISFLIYVLENIELFVCEQTSIGQESRIV